MANNYDNLDGVWRTIGGRRVFIKKGQSLEEAMKESGKFGKKEGQETGKLSRVAKNQDLYKRLEEENKNSEKTLADVKSYTDKQIEEGKNPLFNKKENMSLEKYNELYDKKVYDEGMSEREFKKQYGERPTESEFELYQRAKNNPDSIDPMTENSTDWEALEKKYGGKEKKFTPRAKGSKTFEEHGVAFKDYETNERFSDYLRDKYGTDDLDIITTGSEKTPKSLRDEFNQKSLKDYQNKMLNDDNYLQTNNPNAYFNKMLKESGVKTFADETKEKNQKEKDWRTEVKKNNEQLEKDLEKYQKTHDMSRESEGYYELFRENERRNAKIKQEVPEEKYEPLEAYAGYREKSYRLAGTKEQNGEVVEFGDKSWSGKEYTNDEFMEHLEDSNWHSERKQLLDANLTNQELAYIKDHTTLSQWGVGEELTGKANVQKLIDEAKDKFGGGNQITNALKNKAYQNYMKQHPNSKMTLEEFKNR